MASALGTLALQMGFKSRKLASAQQEVWDVKGLWDEDAIDRKDVGHILEELSQVLIGLRNRQRDFQVEGLTAIPQDLML